MAQYVEPIDIDTSVCDFDDKENAFHHNNVLPRTPCTEKGYEELDVSELNMKLRYSITPASSPMSKSYTVNCFDNKTCESNDTLECENGNMTCSLHTTLTKNDTINKTLKSLPIQVLPTDHTQIGDGNRNILQPLEPTVTSDKNIIITVSEPNYIDENLSLPSSSSSMAHTPEATTPTKEIPQMDGGSPFMRGLKSFISKFRASQSPIPGEDDKAKLETLSPPIVHSPETSDKSQTVSASTPLVGHTTKDPLNKKSSISKENLIFKEDLEKELEWSDDSTIIFSNEKIPIHKLFFQQSKSVDSKRTLNMTKSINQETEKQKKDANMDETLEYMDISYNDSGIMDKTATNLPTDVSKKSEVSDSDIEFLDCESTFTKNDSKPFPENVLDSTEDVLSHINDIVEENNLNSSSETLNASSAKSTNLSTASTETTKQESIENLCNELSSKGKEIVKVEISPMLATNDRTVEQRESQNTDEVEVPDVLKSSVAVPAVSDTTILDPNASVLKEVVLNDVTQSNLGTDYNVNTGSPVIENIGVKSISQIPLITDPRVLLFNIPPIVDNECNKAVIDTLPSEIPLPDDDDMPSLPVMHNELENLSQTLDKIAEEIPKIKNVNIGELFEQSVESVSDNKMTVSISLENNDIIASVMQLNSSEESKPQADLPTKEKLDELEKQDTEKTEKSGSQDEVVLSTSAFNTNILDHILPSETEKSDIPSEIKIEHASICEAVVINDSEKVDNLMVPHSVTTVINELLSIPDKIDQSKVEPMEISVNLGVQSSVELDNSQTIDEANNNAGILKFETSDITALRLQSNGEGVVHFTKADSNIQINKDKLNLSKTIERIIPEDKSVIISKIKIADNAPNESPVEKSYSNIEIIKQEVEAIVENAIDIAMEQSRNKNEIKQEDTEELKSNTIIENNSNETQHKDTKNDFTETIELKQDQVTADYSSPTEIISTNVLIHDAVVTPQKNDTKAQQESLNLLSDNKYNYTVHDNILATEENPVEKRDITLSASIIDEIKVMDIESNSVDESKTLPVANSDQPIVRKVADEINVTMQPVDVIDEQEEMDVTPPDMEKIELVSGNDEEITVSENNSPFVLIPQETKDAEEPLQTNSFEHVEKPLASETSLCSSIIVSKGYNFNFDEIDDPFATKTKIRLSPALDVSPNQTFENKIDQEPPKKDFSKNRRKSQPERKRPAVNNKKLNSTFAGKSNNLKNALVTNDVPPPITHNKIVPMQDSEQVPAKQCENITDIPKDEHKALAESSRVVPSNNKEISSLEQSCQFSVGTSSDKTVEAKTDFQVPDLDDSNPLTTKSKMRESPLLENAVANPFETRSRICQTPPPPNIEDATTTESKLNSSTETFMISQNIDVPATYNTETVNKIPGIDKTEDKIESPKVNNEATPKKETLCDKSIEKTDVLENSLKNVSITTCSSNNAKDCTVREVNTEDEDTVEGPFFEADLLIDDKMSDFGTENVDMMQFSDVPQENDDNPEAGELFIDAEAFEFLLNQNNENTVIDSGKESLFLKFDPLFAKRVSTDGVMAALKHIQKQVKQSTPKHDKVVSLIRDKTSDNSSAIIPRDTTFDKSSPLVTPKDATFDNTSLAEAAGPSGINITQDVDFNSTAEESCDDFNITVSKPMMVVNPAVNPVVTPRNKTLTPVRSNRQSLTFTSPAIAVIDRLLSMSTNNSFMTHDTSVAEVHRDNEADLALTQLRELLADKEINVYNLRYEAKELQGRVATLELQMKNLETISEDRLKKINELNEMLDEKTRINRRMAQVVEEYERTIASLIAETEMDKKRHAEERLQLIKERDEQTAHLASMEVSFSDLHSKYEKSKQVLLGFKSNEDAYKKSIKEFEDNLAKMQNNYELLKQHATSKLNHANEELQKINRSHEAEVLKLNALIKRKDLHITSLEETLQQKTKANEELTAICDELINKVG